MSRNEIADLVASFKASGGKVTQVMPARAPGVKTQARLPHPSSKAYAALQESMNAVPA